MAQYEKYNGRELHPWSGQPRPRPQPQPDDEESFPIREALPRARGFVEAPEAVDAFKAATPEIPWGANLGLATTRQLLEELAVRGEVPEPGDDPEMSHEVKRAARLALQGLPVKMLDYRPAKGGTMEQRMLDLLKHGDREALESVMASFAAKYGDPITTERILNIVQEYLPILEQHLRDEFAVTNGG